MSMRAQVSLQFDDTELFENFVTPYKESRLLNSLIIKLLSKYYYDEEFRCLAEGTSPDDNPTEEEIQITQSIVDNIRSSLVMQDYLASELENYFKNGDDKLNNILNKTNKVIEESKKAENLKVSDVVSKLLSPNNNEIILSLVKELDESKRSLEAANSSICSLKEQIEVHETVKADFESLQNECVSLMKKQNTKILNQRAELERLQKELKEYKQGRKSYGAFDNAVIVSDNHAVTVSEDIKKLVADYNNMLKNGIK